MTIAQALKEKNRLLKVINALKQKIHQHNSVLKGNQPTYDTQELYQELLNITEKFIELKTNITKANQPISEKIYRINELRSLASFLKYLNTKDGKSLNSGYNNSIVLEWEANIKANQADVLVDGIENEIDQIQNEVDSFNFQTSL